VATTGAGVSHLEVDDDLVSRLRSLRTTGEDELFIGTPSKSSDTNNIYKNFNR
jgi:hypothetical protein